MPYQLHSQHIDAASGMHVIDLRNEKGHVHLAQIALLHDSCIACGHVHPKDGLDQLDPKARVEELLALLNKSHASMQDYARRHNLKVK